MTDQWHYSKDGGKSGPVSARELKRLAGIGTLRPADLVWKDGMANWRPAGKIKGLFATIHDPAKFSSPPKTILNQTEKRTSIASTSNESTHDSQTTKKPTTLAIASLCTGIPGICCFPIGAAAIVLGICALREINVSNGSKAGKEMAISGLAFGVIGILMAIIILSPNPESLSDSTTEAPANVPADPEPLQTSDSKSDRYTNREIEEAKAAWRSAGGGENIDDDAAESLLDLKTIMEAEDAGRL